MRMEGSLKGGLSRPVLGVMKNFWWEGGMCMSSAMVSERSCIVAEES